MNEDLRQSRGRRKPQASFPVAGNQLDLPVDYQSTLTNLKERIANERLRVTLSANAAMVLLYWDIGQTILNRQDRQGWGAKIIDHLSEDLKEAFPEMHGFSPRNLKYMRTFAQEWPDREIVQRTVAQTPWRSNLALLHKLKDSETRLHERQGKAPNNFALTLPPKDSDMAVQVFKDPYLFDFLGTADTRREREVEQALIDHVQKFLLELGAGFAFVGRHVHLEVGGDE